MDAAGLIRSALHRSDQVLHAQFVMPEPLCCGTAYCADRFGALPDANQVRDVLLGDLSCADAHATIDAHFATRGRRCLRWALSSDQPLGPIDADMATRGWSRRERIAFGQPHLPTGELLGPTKGRPPADLRILPARAMRRAYRATFVESGDVAADAAHERLDDANYDAFVATLANVPAGRIGLLQAGDICRVHDLHVLPASRRLGIGHALLRHALQLAYRLRPRVVVADARSGEASEEQTARRLLESFGLEEAGRFVEWERN